MIGTFVEVVLLVVIGIVLTSLILAFIGVVRGPTLADRVAALELVNVLAVAFIAVYTAWSGQVAFVDASVALALIAFVSTIAFARFIERGTGS